jgi:hypothetical protein
MSRAATRLVKILMLAAMALTVAASSGAAAGPARTPILGVVPHTGSQLAPAPHMLSTAIHAAGPTNLTFDASYQNVINQYFTDVAHDSAGTQNVYSVATQYYDNPGPVHIQYQSTFGGSYVDKDPLPANGCDDGVDPYCLTDQQLQDEIQTVLTAKGWHGGLDHVFFLMTPNGVGSCVDAFPDQCSTNAFCAYHSAFVDSSSEDVIYANEPYEGPYPGCTDPTQGFPSDIDADTTVNTISHEHNESITDPQGDAWLANDGNGDESADLCAYGFGTALGGTPGVDAYNQVINGHHYDLQQEYSNLDNGCIQRPGGTPSSTFPGTSGPLVYHGGPVMHTNTTYAIYWLPTARNTSPPVVTGAPAVNHTLTTSAGSWTAGGASYSYQWQRCSSAGTGCVAISGATADTYKLTSADVGHAVRSTVRATNVNGASQPASSTGTAAVVDVPAVTKAPHISGHARVGKKLSGSHGTWTFSPTYRYQWLRCNAHGGHCSSIHHATQSTYKLTRRDAHHRLRLHVTAANAAGRKTAVSSATARVPAAKKR